MRKMKDTMPVNPPLAKDNFRLLKIILQKYKLNIKKKTILIPKQIKLLQLNLKP